MMGVIQIPNIHRKTSDMYNSSSRILSEKGLVFQRALLLTLANSWPFASWWSLCGWSCKQIWIRASIPSHDQQNHPWLGLQLITQSLKKGGKNTTFRNGIPSSVAWFSGIKIWLQLTTPSVRWKENVEPQDDLWYPSPKRHGCSHL